MEGRKLSGKVRSRFFFFFENFLILSAVFELSPYSQAKLHIHLILLLLLPVICCFTFYAKHSWPVWYYLWQWNRIYKTQIYLVTKVFIPQKSRYKRDQQISSWRLKHSGMWSSVSEWRVLAILKHRVTAILTIRQSKEKATPFDAADSAFKS
jgi:hypothetical protein